MAVVVVVVVVVVLVLVVVVVVVALVVTAVVAEAEARAAAGGSSRGSRCLHVGNGAVTGILYIYIQVYHSCCFRLVFNN